MLRFSISMQDNIQVELQLTAEHYKEQFDSFLQEYPMTYAEAYELKIMIQSRIIAMATGQGNNFIESPKFRNIHEQVPYRRNFPVLNEEYSQTEVISASEYSPKLTNNQSKSIVKVDQKIIKNQLEKQPRLQNYQEKRQQQVSQSLFPEIQTSNQLFSEQETNSLKKRYFMVLETTVKKMNSKIYAGLRDNLSTSKKDQHKYISSRVDKKISPDRLYYQLTENFRNRLNKTHAPYEQLSETELAQLQSYRLKNNLRRTSPSFFKDLNKKHTASSSKKINKLISQQQSQQSTKIIIDQSFPSSYQKKLHKGMIVPSEYQSKSRCEMKEINKHREEEQAVRAKENERIRERIKAEGSSLERRKEEYKHRICSKCRPAEQQNNKSVKQVQKVVKRQAQPKTNLRNYMSNILSESYEQFKQGGQ